MNDQHPSVAFSVQDKDTKYHSSSQIQRFYEYLQDHIVTCSVAARDLGIPQKCLTRYKRWLEVAGLLHEVYRRPCPITGLPAWHLTTNPEWAPEPDPQLSFKGF